MSILQEEFTGKDDQVPVEFIDVSCEIEIEYDENNRIPGTRPSKSDDLHSFGLRSILQPIETGPSEYDESESERHYIQFDDDDDTYYSSESDNSLKSTRVVDTVEEEMMMIFEDEHKNTVLATDVKKESEDQSKTQKIDGLLFEEVPVAIKEEVIDLNDEQWNTGGCKVDSIACVEDNDCVCNSRRTLHLGPNDRYVTIKSIASSDNIEPITVLVRNVDSDKPICEPLEVPSNRKPQTKLTVKIHKLRKSNKTKQKESRSTSSLLRKSQLVSLPAPMSLFPRICLKDTMPLHCVLCNIECSNRKALIEHVKSHSADKKSFECPTCKKTFTQQCNLKRHMRCHSGERPFSCPYCKKLFADQGYLTTHLRYHTNTKPYTCEHCDKSFFDRSNYVKHLKSHSGEKPYPCQICNKSFLQQSDLTRHTRVHSGERPFKCSHCERSFTQHGDLTTHLRHHTGERPFVCSDCQKTFANKRYLNSHVKGRICLKKKGTNSKNSKTIKEVMLLPVSLHALPTTKRLMLL